MDWGASEGQSKLQLFRELDDAVSLLGDQVRKVINPFWLFTGTTKPTTQPTAVPVGAGLTPVAQSGREELAAMYVPNPDVKAMPLIGNINIADTIGQAIFRWRRCAVLKVRPFAVRYQEHR